MSGRLSGKVCLITGMGMGIGKATAITFCREGATVVGCDMNLDAANDVAAEVRASGGKIEIYPEALDLTVYANCEKFVAFAEDAAGGVDVMVANAAQIANAFMDDITVDVWDKCMRSCLDIAFYQCLAAWPALVRRGGGSIVNFGSVRGQVPSPNIGAVAYMAAKAGVIGMTKQMALEGGRHRIRVNSVSPGMAGGEQGKVFQSDPVFQRAVAPLRVLGRRGTPQDVANYVLFLASDESSFVTGTDQLIDGGSSIATTASVRFCPEAMPG